MASAVDDIEARHRHDKVFVSGKVSNVLVERNLPEWVVKSRLNRGKFAFKLRFS